MHRHPWITFLFFFPTFLTLEAIAAVAIYLYFVATAPSSFSSAKHSLEVRAGEEEDLRTTPLPFGGSGSGASSPLTTTTNNESEEPPTSATPSDYEHLLDDSELVHGDEEEEVAAAAAARRVEERRRRRRQESMRLGRGGVGMSAASLGGGGGGGAGVEAEVEAGETESYMEGDSASDGDGRGGEETGVGFGLEEMEEAEWVKGEEDQEEGASTVAAVSCHPLFPLSLLLMNQEGTTPTPPPPPSMTMGWSRGFQEERSVKQLRNRSNMLSCAVTVTFFNSPRPPAARRQLSDPPSPGPRLRLPPPRRRRASRGQSRGPGNENKRPDSVAELTKVMKPTCSSDLPL